MIITSNVRIGRTSYPQLESAKSRTLHLDDKATISGLPGGLVYAPDDHALAAQQGLDDRTLQLGALTLAAQLGHLPSLGHAAVIAASPGYRQYAAQALLAPLRGPMGVQAQILWWQTLAAVVDTGEQPGLPAQLVGSAAPAQWLRDQTRLVSQKSEWFVSLAFAVGQSVQPLQGTREGTGIDIGLRNLATLATGQRIAFAPRSAAPDWQYFPPGLLRSPEHRALYDTVQYTAARGALESLTGQLTMGATFVALEKLNLKSFRSRFPEKARRMAVIDWAWSTLPQVLHAHDVPLVRVDARGTSQECHACHSRLPDQRRRRRFACRRPGCGVVMDADANAARVIGARGAAQLRR